MDINTIILIIIFILLIAGIPFCFFLVGYKLTQFNKECEKAKIRALDTFNKNKGKIAKQIDNQIKELGGKKQMQIDEFEFRDKNGNEIEPTKNQLVVYIKSLHKQIKDLKETQKEFAVSRLEELFYGLQEEKYTTIFGAQEEPIQVLERSQVLDYINNRIEKLKGELK
mgnify:CR=1 FL=1